MAKERLSKLQKWVLIECYENKTPDFPTGILLTQLIIKGYFGSRTKSKEVIVSRSIRSLIDKKYVQGLSVISASNMAILYGMAGKSKEEAVKNLSKYKTREKLILPFRGLGKVKAIILTNQGIKKVKELLKLSSNKVSKLNNKET